MWDLLRSLDDPKHLETPADFNFDETKNRFRQLVDRLNTAFSCACEAEGHVEDASYHDRVEIPAAATATGTRLVIVVSNFGGLAVVAADNPGVNLPNQDIVVVHRSDGSGTSDIFTTYLAAVSPDWQKKVSKGLSVSWPTGIGGKGSEGVTGLVKQNPGAIGYVELSYTEENKLPVAQVQNKAGEFVSPTAGNVGRHRRLRPAVEPGYSPTYR